MGAHAVRLAAVDSRHADLPKNKTALSADANAAGARLCGGLLRSAAQESPATAVPDVCKAIMPILSFPLKISVAAFASTHLRPRRFAVRRQWRKGLNTCQRPSMHYSVLRMCISRIYVRY
jgi:hypothetical protein